jgi:hypothetical protein
VNEVNEVSRAVPTRKPVPDLAVSCYSTAFAGLLQIWKPSQRTSAYAHTPPNEQ